MSTVIVYSHNQPITEKKKCTVLKDCFFNLTGFSVILCVPLIGGVQIHALVVAPAGFNTNAYVKSYALAGGMRLNLLREP